MRYTPKPLHGNPNVTPTSPLREFFILLGGAFGFLAAIYVVLGFAVDLVVPHIPLAMEETMGRFFTSALSREAEDEAARAHLQRMVDEMAVNLPESERTFVVHLLESETVNAKAAPGGHIVMYSALVHQADSENELAFVLGHELGHFAHRDHLRGLGRGLVLFTLSATVLGADNGITEFLVNALVNVETRFSQEQELSADAMALELLIDRYGHAGGAITFMERMAENEKHGRLEYFFATHPFPGDRVLALEERIRNSRYAIQEPRPIPDLLLPPPPSPTPQE